MILPVVANYDSGCWNLPRHRKRDPKRRAAVIGIFGPYHP